MHRHNTNSKTKSNINCSNPRSSNSREEYKDLHHYQVETFVNPSKDVPGLLQLHLIAKQDPIHITTSPSSPRPTTAARQDKATLKTILKIPKTISTLNTLSGSRFVEDTSDQSMELVDCSILCLSFFVLSLLY